MNRVRYILVSLVVLLAITGIVQMRAKALVLTDVTIVHDFSGAECPNCGDYVTKSDGADKRYIVDRSYDPDHFFEIWGIREKNEPAMWFDASAEATIDLPDGSVISGAKWRVDIYVKADEDANYSLEVKLIKPDGGSADAPKWTAHRDPSQDKYVVAQGQYSLDTIQEIDRIWVKAWAEGHENKPFWSFPNNVEIGIRFIEIAPIEPKDQGCANYATVCPKVKDGWEVPQIVGNNKVWKITVSDATTGLKQIQSFCKFTQPTPSRCFVTVPAFAPGTNDEIVLTVTKPSSAPPIKFWIKIFDFSGNQRIVPFDESLILDQ